METLPAFAHARSLTSQFSSTVRAPHLYTYIHTVGVYMYILRSTYICSSCASRPHFSPRLQPAARPRGGARHARLLAPSSGAQAARSSKVGVVGLSSVVVADSVSDQRDVRRTVVDFRHNTVHQAGDSPQDFWRVLDAELCEPAHRESAPGDGHRTGARKHHTRRRIQTDCSSLSVTSSVMTQLEGCYRATEFTLSGETIYSTGNVDVEDDRLLVAGMFDDSLSEVRVEFLPVLAEKI